MTSLTMAAKLLEVADSLLAAQPRSSAFRRRAVSTAYYAAFHALARVCADYLSRSASRSLLEYERVYRALDHGPLKQAFSESPLKDNRRLNEIGQSIVKLQAERFRADYMPPIQGIFDLAGATELVSIARQTVSQIEEMRARDDDTRVLVTALHFPIKRKQK